jgi:quercetin dioxygenase-like cupin family protein
MRSLKVAVSVAAGTLLVWAGAVALGAGSSGEVVMPAGQMQFKEIVPGATRAVLWGDPDKGAHAAVTRFTKGLKVALHTHTHDFRIVVISGTFVYDSGSGEKRLGPGSYLRQPGGVPHVSGAGNNAECVFFLESDGAFDLNMVK